MPAYEKSEFTPAYKEGWTLKMHQGGQITNIKILALRPLASHRHDFGNLATVGIAELDKECTHLAVADKEIAQFRYVIQTNFEITLRHPPATAFYAARSPSEAVGENWRMRPWILDDKVSKQESDFLWIASEFWILANNRPKFDVYPLLSQAVPLPMHVEFFGWKYKFEEFSGEGQSELWIDRFV